MVASADLAGRRVPQRTKRQRNTAGQPYRQSGIKSEVACPKPGLRWPQFPQVLFEHLSILIAAVDDGAFLRRSRPFRNRVIRVEE